jgi:hypothetical protein
MFKSKISLQEDNVTLFVSTGSLFFPKYAKWSFEIFNISPVTKLLLLSKRVITSSHFEKRYLPLFSAKV